jgi:hypothetical protein
MRLMRSWRRAGLRRRRKARHNRHHFFFEADSVGRPALAGPDAEPFSLSFFGFLASLLLRICPLAIARLLCWSIRIYDQMLGRLPRVGGYELNDRGRIFSLFAWRSGAREEFEVKDDRKAIAAIAVSFADCVNLSAMAVA